jgi:hypothetical protein
MLRVDCYPSFAPIRIKPAAQAVSGPGLYSRYMGRFPVLEPTTGRVYFRFGGDPVRPRSHSVGYGPARTSLHNRDVSRGGLPKWGAISRGALLVSSLLTMAAAPAFAQGAPQRGALFGQTHSHTS